MPIQVLSADETIFADQDPIAFWPTKPEQQAQRLNPMCLPAIRPSFMMRKDDPIFTIGSCFARNVEKQLIVEGFNVAAAQFPNICAEEGVNIRDDVLNKFVAASIYNEIRWALDPGASFDEDSFVSVGRDRFVDMQLAHGMIPAKIETVRAVRRAVSRYMAMLRDAKIIVITLGLAEAWYDRQLGIYLNRAPQKLSAELFPNRFELHVLSYDDIVAALENIIDCLKAHGREDFRIILTVSPVALGMTWTEDDALVANCYSKSVQRAAAAYIYKKHECVDYLPSYESVTLSDRRIAWRADAAHVADEAVRMNVLRMLYAYTGIQGTEEEDQKRAVALQLVRDADVANREGRAADAMRAVLLAKETAPNEVAVSYKLGELLVADRRFEEAIPELERAHSLGGARYGAADKLGLALMKVGRARDAIPYLEEAVALRLKASKAPRYLAEAYAATGERERALDFLLNRAIPEADKKASLAFTAATLLFKLGRIHEAADMAKVAVAEAPDVEKFVAFQHHLAELQNAA